MVELLLNQFLDRRAILAHDLIAAVDRLVVGYDYGQRAMHRIGSNTSRFDAQSASHTSREEAGHRTFVEKQEVASPRLKLLQLTTTKEHTMRNFSGKAPTFVVWVISLVLFVVALLAQFGVVRMGAPIATWSWIIGFGLLLLACRVKGL